MTLALMLAKTSTTVAPWQGWSLFLLTIVAAIVVAIAGELRGRRHD